MKRLTLAVLFTAALMLAVALPAAANPPQSDEVYLSVDCGGGVGFEGTLVVTELVTNSGIVHWNVQGVLVGSNGVEVRVNHAWTETESWLAGLPFSSWVGGLSVRDAGLVRVDGFVAGPHPLAFEFELDGAAATCYLVDPQ